MANQVTALGLVLAKEQAAFGTAETGLLAADILEIQEGGTVEHTPRVAEIALVGGGWTQNQSVIGPRDATVSIALPMRTGAVEGNAGQCALLLGACGTKVTASDTDADETDDRFIYEPSAEYDDWKDITFWDYSGNLDSGNSLITKVHNVVGSCKIDLDFSTCVATLSFEGKGVLTGVPALGTQPAVTPNTVVVPSLGGATVSFFSDTDYNLLSLGLDIGMEATPTLNPGASDGSVLGVTLPTKMRSTWSAKVYHDSSVNPHTSLIAGTLGTISSAWGTTPNAFTVSSSKAQITSCKVSEDGGVTCYDLSGIFVDNDVAVQIDTAVV